MTDFEQTLAGPSFDQVFGSLPGGKGDKGDPGGNVMAIGLAAAAASLVLASGALATTNTFRTDGYTSAADGGEAWYRRKAVIEADEPGQLASSDGVRLGLVPTQDLSIEMFGGIANDSSSGAKTANDAAVTAANTFGAVIQDGSYGTVWSLKFPNGAYYFGDLAGHDFKLARRWKGAESGAAIAGGVLRTQLIVPAGCKFLRPQMPNTTGETTLSPSTTTAAGAMFVDLDFVGNGGATPSPVAPNTAGYAIHPRCPIAAWNCRFRYHWNAIYNNAAAGAGGAEEGQASHCHYFQCSFEQNFNAGIHNDADSDNNITTYTHCNFIANGRAGVLAHEFLGSNFAPTCHFRDNGCRTDYFNVSSQCYYGGNGYYVNETATISTTDTALRVGNPSTNSLWTLVGAVASPWANYPDFSTFTGTFQKGGPVLAERTTSARFTAVGYYGEGGQPPFFWNLSCFIAPQLSGNGDTGYGVGIIDGRLVTDTATILGQTLVQSTSNTITETLWNNQPSAAGLLTSLLFAQGLEVDGVTPMRVARISTYHTSTSPTTAEGLLLFGTRTFGGTGGFTDWVQLDGPNKMWAPITTNQMDLGHTSFRWKNVFGYTGDFTTQVKVNGVKVLGAQDTGWAADTGTAKKTATATYAVGSALTVGAAYVQAEHTAIITRQALIEAALRDATQEIKALKDALIAHGVIGT